jgi:hypothetical protein
MNSAWLRFEEVVDTLEARGIVVRIGTKIFLDRDRYNWTFRGGTCISNFNSFTNSQVYNAELSLIAYNSHKRSAEELQKARGKGDNDKDIPSERKFSSHSIISFFFTVILSGPILLYCWRAHFPTLQRKHIHRLP